MATNTVSGKVPTRSSWPAGVIGGIAGAAVMGALVLAMNPGVIEGAIPALYTLKGGTSGLTIHLSHGAILGVVFAGIVGWAELDSPGELVGAGIGWGVLTWVVLAALVMPVWLQSVGFPKAPGVPNFAPPSLLWHVVYGGVLGGVYSVLDDQF